MPNVTWWHETTLLDDTSVILSGNRVKNVLNLQKIERRQLHMVYTCQASNNNVTMPIVSSITLDVNCKYKYPNISNIIFLVVFCSFALCFFLLVRFITPFSIGPFGCDVAVATATVAVAVSRFSNENCIFLELVRASVCVYIDAV